MGRLRIKKKNKRQLGICAFCHRRAKATHHCRTCESLRDAGKRDEVFHIQFCRAHAPEAQSAIRRHALGAHPVNILRAAGAVLRGGSLD
jgi:hypothetical protein